jgi:hypothetical protein
MNTLYNKNANKSAEFCGTAVGYLNIESFFLVPIFACTGSKLELELEHY